MSSGESLAPVPDEAWKAASDAVAPEFRESLERAVEAAAPFIARAAVVQELRDMAVRLGRDADYQSLTYVMPETYAGLKRAVSLVTARADELEGQNDA